MSCYHSPGGLVGRLLPRMLLKERGISPRAMQFSKTEAGKPYITTEGLDTPIGYNITHDSGLIAMAFTSGDDLYPDPPAYRIGLDVMQLRLPRRETFAGFVDIVSDQLTSLERDILLPPSPAPPLTQAEALRRFYLIWTLKEAYTKALGLGLGFNFRRIEYDVPRDVVRIDGVIPRGWKFVRFQLQCRAEGAREEAYVGVVARFIGDGMPQEGECTVESRTAGSWLKVYNAVDFMDRAVRELS
ncbi:hypothetical protein AcW1_004544 [Taiwanofungus camphoratus]|nr:hypothetical protein AcW2_006450 [Antrodia cinnamomea]KAI0939544.1 hypothetical protein AcV5_000926 [Antrodia cinnamomea]KAI0952459.1 hypothetical protein AcV7_008257 [Antrodia cinnamomea]KAI0959837.1 hypothetical protein AcW1_004544 [Antrodia cinnamomea]